MIVMASMRPADHLGNDYNLLPPLLALLEELHVTRAAERCAMSQPAMSRALERARRSLGDDLIVRRGTEYVRTPRGERLVIELRDLLPRLDTVMNESRFDPATSRERFRIVKSEFAAMLFVPSLVASLAAVAPDVSLACAPWRETSFDAMRDRRHDLAVIGLDGLAGLTVEPLFADEFVCAVARDHPIGDEPMTLERYASFPHAVLDVAGRRQQWIDRPLFSRGIKRRIGFVTPSQTIALLALPGTEMICTLSRAWCERFASLADIRLVPAPPNFEPLRYGMAWHPSATDASAVWFRERVRDAVATFARP